MSKSKKTKRRSKKVSVKQITWNGDHGTGTQAANVNTEVKPLEGSNPNRVARRQRVNQIERMKPNLSLRQYQAARAIQDAHSRVEILSSGGELKERVDTSARPDSSVAHHIDAQSALLYVMEPVPAAMRDVVEHVCWYNCAITQLASGGNKLYNRLADFKVALDLVANHMGY